MEDLETTIMERWSTGAARSAALTACDGVKVTFDGPKKAMEESREYVNMRTPSRHTAYWS